MFILDDGAEYRNYHETGKNGVTFCNFVTLYMDKTYHAQILRKSDIQSAKTREIDESPFVSKHFLQIGCIF